MKRSVPTSEKFFARYDLARDLHYRGRSAREIVQELSKKRLFDATQSQAARLRAVQRLLARVKADDLARFRALRADSEKAWAEFIQRHTRIFELAIKSNQLECARSASKDLAVAAGLDVKNASAPDFDLYAVLMTATRKNREARLNGAFTALPAPSESIPATAVTVPESKPDAPVADEESKKRNFPSGELIQALKLRKLH